MLIRIENVAFEGPGVGRSNGLVVFVPFTLPGELVNTSAIEQKKNFGKATLLEVVEKSPSRVNPLCPYFSFCGGCQLQHSSYDNQTILKKKFVEDSLLRIGKISFPVPPIVPSPTPLAYRRHISLQLHFIENAWKLCFTSLELKPLPIQSCVLFHEENDLILENLENSLAKFSSSMPLEGRLKIFKTLRGYIIACSLKKNISAEEERSLSNAFLETAIGVYIQTPEKIIEKGDLELSFEYENLKFYYSPFGFVQNHPKQTENILDLIRLLLKDSKKILDLYCGIGASTLLLAKDQKEIIGVEISEESIFFAKKNSKENSLEHISFFCASAETKTKELLSSFLPDSILVNPPKTGLDKEMRKLLDFQSIKQIVYVSCHPPTLARDLSFLQTLGFTISSLQSFDCFPQTTHVETVVNLKRE